MTEQEEIKKGVVRLGYDVHDVEEIFNYLHSQGVVIKVDREPDEVKQGEDERNPGEAKYYGDMPSEMYADGWRLVKPLIG